MSYSSNESAVRQTLLVELFEFRIGVLVYRYTSSDADKTPSDASGFKYQSEYIKRSSAGQNDELNQEDLSVNVHQAHAIAQLYLGRPPDQTVTLTVFRYHEEGIAEEDVVVHWSGRVLSCVFGDEGTATLTCESTATSMKQPGLKRTYQGSCPHALYGVQCGAIQANQEFFTTVGAVTGVTVSATGASVYPDDHFTGGFLNWLGSDGNPQSRMILSSAGEILTLDWEIEKLKVLDQIWVYPGCKHNMSDCFNKFQNIVNYGGFPFVPLGSNPFDTTVY